MNDSINIEQLKEFLEFRIKNVENKVDAIPIKMEKMHSQHLNNDEAQSLSIQGIGDKVNLIWKAIGVVLIALVSVIAKVVVG
jgi:hypothetical protein